MELNSINCGVLAVDMEQTVSTEHFENNVPDMTVKITAARFAVCAEGLDPDLDPPRR